MMATELDHAEALRVLHSTCRLYGVALPQEPQRAVEILIAIAGGLPEARSERAEACLLVAVEFAAAYRPTVWADFDARR